MPLDPSIPLQVQSFKAPDSMNMLAQVMQIQNAQNQNALTGYTLNKAQRQDQQTNALMSALQGGLDISTPDGQTKALSIAPEAAQSFIKNRLDNLNTQAQIGQRTAEGSKQNAEALTSRVAQYRDASQAVTDPAGAAQLVQSMYADPALKGSPITAMPIESFLQHIPQDPAAFKTWQQQFALGAQKYIELNKPTTNVVNTGGVTQMVQTPGLGGVPTVAGTMQNTVSPDTVANNRTAITTTGMNNATSTANNRANINKDYAINGLNPDGSANTGNQSALVDMLGKYQLNPTLALQRLPVGARAALVSQVQAKYPGWDETTYDAKKNAANAFTAGDQGNTLRSVSTANAHLDQLGTLVDAMGNGNTQIINRVGNYFATQLGDPKITNFDAIKDVVGQEVVKALVPGGGTGNERDKAQAAFDAAKSPAQLKGVIEHYRAVMAAQQANLLAQRDAAGLPRSTLPNYTGSAAPAAASGLPPMSAIDAELARRGGK